MIFISQIITTLHETHNVRHGFTYVCLWKIPRVRKALSFVNLIIKYGYMLYARNKSLLMSGIPSQANEASDRWVLYLCISKLSCTYNSQSYPQLFYGDTSCPLKKLGFQFNWRLPHSGSRIQPRVGRGGTLRTFSPQSSIILNPYIGSYELPFHTLRKLSQYRITEENIIT